MITVPDKGQEEDCTLLWALGYSDDLLEQADKNC